MNFGRLAPSPDLSGRSPLESELVWQCFLDRRLVRLIIDIERIDYIRNAITVVRRDLPDEVLETERKLESHGRQPALVS